MRTPLEITPLKTTIFHEGNSLTNFLEENLQGLPFREGDILAITSKIVSLAEGRTVKKDQIDKQELIIKESDHDLGEVAFGCRLTVKHGLFIPSAGIDESNSEKDDYILYPVDPFASAQKIHSWFRERFRLERAGILLTDSHTLPLRQGVTGIALSYWGFHGVRSMVGREDLFGRKLKMTQMDLADGLAASAVLMMGEADETFPLALIRGAPVDFAARISPAEIQIPIEEDLYFPLYRERLKTNGSPE